MIKIKLYLVFSLVFCTLINAQNQAVELLQKSSDTVDKLTNYSVSLTMKTIAGGLDGELIETTDGMYKKSADNSYSELGSLIAIQQPQKAIVIDKENNNIIITEKPSAKDKNTFLEIYKQLIPFVDTVYTTYNNDSSAYVVCKYKKVFGVFYDRIEMLLNKKSYLPEKILMYTLSANSMYDDEFAGRNIVLTIDYKNWILNASLPSNLFDFNNYAYKNGEQWLPAKKFENFEVTIMN